MATSGDVADLFAREMGIGRGTLVERFNGLRYANLLPSGGRGITAPHYGIAQIGNCLLAACLDPPPGAAAKLVKTARTLPRHEGGTLAPFGDLSITEAPTLAEAIHSLIKDAISGRLQQWKASGHGLCIDFIDGHYAHVETQGNVIAHRRDVGQIAFVRPNTRAVSPSLYRIMRLDSRIFEKIAEMLTRSETRDPVTGERVLTKL
jgi:hypothetical protein